MSMAARSIHPALHLQREFACVGVEDARGYPSSIIKQADGPAAQHNSLALPNGYAVSEKPLSYKMLRMRWPAEDVTNFLLNPTAPAPGDVLEAIRRLLLMYVEFERPEHAALCACWIVGTYLYVAFPTFPRLNLNGERGSGKTRVLQLIAALGFNGLHFVAPTAANLFRLIEQLRCTLCLDEMEGLDTADDKTMLSILNAGYKKGVSVPRIEGESGSRRPESFDVYAPVAFGSINGLNPVTADRSITLQMGRGHNPAIINRSLDIDDPVFGALRACLYRGALTWGPWIYEHRPELEQLVPPFLQGRNRELWLPLLVLGELAGGPPYRDDLMRVWMEASEAHESLPDDGRALFFVLEDRLKAADTVTLYPKDLCVEISDELGIDLHRGKPIEAKKVGALLRRYGFKRERETNRGVPYRITRAGFIENARRAGYPLAGEWT